MEKEISNAAVGRMSNMDFVRMRAAGKRHVQTIDWVLVELLSLAGDDTSGVENQVLIPVLGPLTFPSVHPKASSPRRGLDTLPCGPACTSKDIEEWERSLMVGEALEHNIRWSSKVPGKELLDYEEYRSTFPVWDCQTIWIHQQNRPAAVRLCDTVAINCHRHMPLVHSSDHSFTVAQLTWSFPVRCVPVEPVALCCTVGL